MYRRYILIVVELLRKSVFYDKRSKTLKLNVNLSTDECEESESEAEKRTFDILQQIADDLDKDIQFEADVGVNHESGKIPCLDLKVWVEGGRKVLFEFYKKEIASKFTVLQRSALGGSTKRNTLFQEALRRLRNCHPDLGWHCKAKHLSEFSNTMRISGYSENYRFDILKGAVKRHREMLDLAQKGEITLYRNREEIMVTKKEKGGSSPNTWYLKGNKTTTLTVAATPGGVLKQQMTHALKGVLAPDKGETMVVERGGKPLLSGLKKKDPFSKEGCKYDDRKCIVDNKVDCTSTGTCYAITCDMCGEEELGQPTDTLPFGPHPPSPPGSRQARWAAGRRRSRPIAQYTGQSGRSLHSRGIEHRRDVRRRDKSSPLVKHILTAHKDGPEPTFTMKTLTHHKTNLQRLISEGLQIERERKENEKAVLNSKAEMGHSKLVRLNPTVTWG